ncbi:MAG TPA: glutaredoxin 3 [Burkholderiales bacterium]|nr:glutaredoxin 3 [Burkholderiales bacterium]
MPKVRMYQTDWCPFCRRAEALLRQKGVVEIEMIDVVLDAKGRSELQAKTGRRTVPQIYIGDTHVGGCDDLQALDRAGKLDPLLAVS